MSGFGFESTADEVLADRDLSGRTALVTGGYSGLGKETARAMAAKGAGWFPGGKQIRRRRRDCRGNRREGGHARL